jgi:sialate O-acetylesterase
MRLLRAVLLVAAVGFGADAVRADVKLHPLFTDNMVIQQGVVTTVWGTADPGERVDVSISAAPGTVAHPVADETGHWVAPLPVLKAGTGYTLTAKGKNTVELKNVAVGEVWICSGQSNMEWSVNISEDPDKVKAGAKHPNLRLFTVQKRTAPRPITDMNDLGHFTKWVECSPETVGTFSAVAYHFGVKLQKELGVPVGLIHTSWGGTPAQAWASLEALDADPSLRYYADAARAAAKQYESFDPKKAQADYEKTYAAWKVAADKAKEDKKPVPKEPAKPGAKPAPLGPGTPTVLYNAMIHPLRPFVFKGAIWYQGESNAGRAYEYRTLFPTMIQDWRNRWRNEFPFMLVQLAPFRGGASGVDYAELRDAQLFATKRLPKVGMAVITDHGNETDIHPKPKQPVGERLALAALGIAYGKQLVYSGPVYRSMAVEGNAAVLRFDHVGGGLVAKGDELTGFQIAGEDREFHAAKAEIKGDTVVVSSEKVSRPVAVRYGWVNFAKPTLNFFNKEGLPATPFRTDSLPLTTDPKNVPPKKAEPKKKDDTKKAEPKKKDDTKKADPKKSDTKKG